MKLLLHMCCAPCAVAIVEKFKQTTDIDVSGYFYNPNIHPEEEYQKRKNSVARMAEDYSITVSYKDENGMMYWKDNLGKDNDLRCKTCYLLRLDEITKYADENGFDSFTTSLLISPYQKHDIIKELANKAAQKYNLKFYYEDFRELYYKGKNISRGKGYYMQKYCGCMYSYSESDHPKKPIYIMV